MNAVLTHSLLAAGDKSDWSGPAIPTLCISVLAFIMSGIALGWQVYSWRRSGARLRIITKWGIAGSPPNPLWFVSIEVSNTGRLATEISQIGFLLSKTEEQKQIVDYIDVLGAPIAFPRTLAPGASTSVMYAATRLLEVLQEERLTGKGARPFAVTGSGRTVGRKRKNLREMAEMLIGAGR